MGEEERKYRNLKEYLTHPLKAELVLTLQTSRSSAFSNAITVGGPCQDSGTSGRIPTRASQIGLCL
jgi:hypothetical protein